MGQGDRATDASKYETKAEWRANSPSAYAVCGRNKWMDLSATVWINSNQSFNRLGAVFGREAKARSYSLASPVHEDGGHGGPPLAHPLF
jgi:hypothetical protein